jgi:tetratricopeptide (TPR) repeat protein
MLPVNMFKTVPALLALLALSFAPSGFAADALVKTVPLPDLSKLPPAQAAELRDTRVQFEKDKPELVGDDLAQAHAMLGAAYARAGFYDAAAVALEDAAALSPNDGRWLYAQGLIARMQKQNPAALGYFEHALSLDKDYLPIRIAVVNARIEQGDLDGARKLLSDFTAKNDKAAVAFALQGDVALRQRRYPDAIDATKRALAIDPSATKLYTQLADAYAGAGNTKLSADARAKAGPGVPGLGDPILLGLLQSTSTTESADAAKSTAPAATQTPENTAEFLLAARQYDAARKTLDDALKAKPNNAELLAIRARVDAAAGDLAQAKSHAQAAVSANPNSHAAQFVLGVVLEMSNDDRGAQAAYEKAIAITPKAAEAYIALGNLLMRGQRYADAETRYRAAIQADPASAEAWSRLIAAEVAGGKCAGAIKEINGALAKDSHNGILMQLFVRLTSTCAASNAEEKRMALDYGKDIYRQSNGAPPIGEAYALALAANGKWDDAVKTQQAARFVVLRNGRREGLPAYRDFLQQFQAKKMPDRPWSATSELMQPQRAAPDAKPVAAAEKAPGAK